MNKNENQTNQSTNNPNHDSKTQTLNNSLRASAHNSPSDAHLTWAYLSTPVDKRDSLPKEYLALMGASSTTSNEIKFYTRKKDRLSIRKINDSAWATVLLQNLRTTNTDSYIVIGFTFTDTDGVLCENCSEKIELLSLSRYVWAAECLPILRGEHTKWNLLEW